MGFLSLFSLTLFLSVLSLTLSFSLPVSFSLCSLSFSISSISLSLTLFLSLLSHSLTFSFSLSLLSLSFSLLCSIHLFAHSYNSINMQEINTFGHTSCTNLPRYEIAAMRHALSIIHHVWCHSPLFPQCKRKRKLRGIMRNKANVIIHQGNCQNAKR